MTSDSESHESGDGTLPRKPRAPRARTVLTTSPPRKRHMTTTGSFSVLRLSAASGTGLPPRTVYEPSDFPQPSRKREGQKPAGHGDGEGTTRRRWWWWCSRKEVSGPIAVTRQSRRRRRAGGPGGTRDSVRAPLKPREESTKPHLIYRGFSKPLACQQPRVEERPSPPRAQRKLAFQQEELQNADVQQPRPSQLLLFGV